MKIHSLVLGLLLSLATLTALAQPQPLLSLADPEGDDVGDGSLVYPRETVAEPGDLDLRLLQVFDEGETLRFEASFRNPVRDPAQVRAGLLGNEDLALFARRGFYAFNLDLYLDLDRQPGSGHRITLPGRRARVDPAHAWERAIVLTPRPELMRRQLREALAETAPAGSDLDAELDRAVHFVRDVRVRGRIVSFSVPTRFVGAQALRHASVIGLVTAAKLSIESDLPSSLLGRPAGSAVQRLPLGVAAPENGRPALAMGYRGDAAPATAIVDLLAADARQQSEQLRTGVLVGQGAERPATPPAGNVAAVPWLVQALEGQAVAAAPARPAPAPAPAAAAAAAAPVATVPAAAAPTPAAPPRTRDAAFLEEQENRLRTLRRLREAGLISEEEYQRKRKEVLDAL